MSSFDRLYTIVALVALASNYQHLCIVLSCLVRSAIPPRMSSMYRPLWTVAREGLQSARIF